ncbi:MAG: hypothetical protein NXY57DRAFT_967611 [Lentinula lateritia]|nr:MAG: hypothetical protein NXY57DRAFT_967611 [Lentinula lateritia]
MARRAPHVPPVQVPVLIVQALAGMLIVLLVQLIFKVVRETAIISTQDREHIKDLERQLASVRNSKEQEGQKRKAPEPRDNASATRRGRAIPKLITVYEDIHTLLAQYDEYHQKGYHQLDFEDDDDDTDKGAEELEEKRRLQRGYAGIVTLHKTVYPDFLKKIKEVGGAHIIRELQMGANSSRAFDTSTVMKFVGDILNEEVRKINQAKLKEYQVKLHAYTENVTMSDSASDLPAATTNTMAEPVLERVEEFCTTSRDINEVLHFLLVVFPGGFGRVKLLLPQACISQVDTLFVPLLETFNQGRPDF